MEANEFFNSVNNLMTGQKDMSSFNEIEEIDDLDSLDDFSDFKLDEEIYEVPADFIGINSVNLVDNDSESWEFDFNKYNLTFDTLVGDYVSNSLMNFFLLNEYVIKEGNSINEILINTAKANVSSRIDSIESVLMYYFLYKHCIFLSGDVISTMDGDKFILLEKYGIPHKVYDLKSLAYLGENIDKNWIVKFSNDSNKINELDKMFFNKFNTICNLCNKSQLNLILHRKAWTGDEVNELIIYLNKNKFIEFYVNLITGEELTQESFDRSKLIECIRCSVKSIEDGSLEIDQLIEISNGYYWRTFCQVCSENLLSNDFVKLLTGSAIKCTSKILKSIAGYLIGVNSFSEINYVVSEINSEILNKVIREVVGLDEVLKDVLAEKDLKYLTTVCKLYSYLNSISKTKELLCKLTNINKIKEELSEQFFEKFGIKDVVLIKDGGGYFVQTVLDEVDNPIDLQNAQIIKVDSYSLANNSLKLTWWNSDKWYEFESTKLMSFARRQGIDEGCKIYGVAQDKSERDLSFIEQGLGIINSNHNLYPLLSIDNIVIVTKFFALLSLGLVSVELANKGKNNSYFETHWIIKLLKLIGDSYTNKNCKLEVMINNQPNAANSVWVTEYKGKQYEMPFNKFLSKFDTVLHMMASSKDITIYKTDERIFLKIGEESEKE